MGKKEKAPTAKKSKSNTPKLPRETSNGTTRPLATGLTGKLWALIDKLSTKGLVERKKFLVAAETAGFRSATAASQYARWRKFMGITGRAPKPAAPKPAAPKPAAPKVPKAKAPKPPVPPVPPPVPATE